MHPSSGGGLMPGIAESKLQLRRASDASANPAKSEHSSNRRARPSPGQRIRRAELMRQQRAGHGRAATADLARCTRVD
ncbi:unnamed protein product [Urochloa humidicola]